MLIAVAEDSAILREGLVRLLAEAGFTVVGQVGDEESLLALVDATRPDVALVDIRMPPSHTDEGLRAAAEIRRRYPATGVLIFSQYLETGRAVSLMSRDPCGFGYLLKDRIADIGELTEAIKRVSAGESVIDAEVVARLLRRRRVASMLDELTDREREVLGLMAQGRSNDGIAQRLSIGAKTVETYVRNIFTKLYLEPSHTDHRRVLAVLAYLRE